MQLSAVLLARAMAWVELFDLAPFGGIYYPILTQKLIERYQFKKFPTAIEDFDQAKGVIFAGGIFEGTVIEQLVIYTYGLVLDTRNGTDSSRKLLEGAFEWAKQEFGLAYSAESVKHWQYGSQLTFHSDADFSTLHPALLKLCRNVSKSVETDIGQQHSYELISLQVDYDQLTSKYPIGRFSIQRRDNTPFSQNKYFSDAPLQTEQHIQILEQFEAELLNQTPPATD